MLTQKICPCLEWAVVAIRNLCDGNTEIQAEVASMQQLQRGGGAQVEVCSWHRQNVSLFPLVIQPIFPLIFPQRSSVTEVDSVRLVLDERTGLLRPDPESNLEE